MLESLLRGMYGVTVARVTFARNVWRHYSTIAQDTVLDCMFRKHEHGITHETLYESFRHVAKHMQSKNGLIVMRTTKVRLRVDHVGKGTICGGCGGRNNTTTTITYTHTSFIKYSISTANY